MRQLNTYHSGMAGYLMDFGFGGFIGYGKGVSVGLVMEELNRCMKDDVRRKKAPAEKRRE